MSITVYNQVKLSPVDFMLCQPRMINSACKVTPKYLKYWNSIACFLSLCIWNFKPDMSLVMKCLKELYDHAVDV